MCAVYRLFEGLSLVARTCVSSPAWVRGVERCCGAEVFRLVAQDLGELGTFRHLRIDGRLDVLLFTIGLSLNFPRQTAVEIPHP